MLGKRFKKIVFLSLTVLIATACCSTALASTTQFSFAVIGDSQNYTKKQTKKEKKKKKKRKHFRGAVKNIKRANVALVLTTGDMISSCRGSRKCRKKLNKWKRGLSSLFPITYPAMGNHDRSNRESSDTIWQDFFTLPTNGPTGYEELVYSFDYGNSHFVVLNSEKPIEHVINSIQRTWLENDLTNNTKENTFIFFHEPAFPTNSKIGSSLDVYPQERDTFWEILDRHNVTAVFNGHEHIYAISKIDSSIFPTAQNTIYQFITGNSQSYKHKKPRPGRGVEYFHRAKHYTIVEINGSQITVKTHSRKGRELSSFTFSK